LVMEDELMMWRPFIARNKLRFFIGMGFISIIMSIFNFLTFAKVWSSTFEFYGIPTWIIYIIVPVGLILLGWYLGYWYEMGKFWEEEVIHQNSNLNPQLMELIDDVKEIKAMLK
jgi:uncharacterized membrane protein YdbT with pleckstrin-like domain